MLDTGCKRAVRGSEWHRDLQAQKDACEEPYYYVPQEEYFKFGPGEPLLSSRAWKYTAGINGARCPLTIAEVEAGVPGLIGPDEMAS